MNFICNSINNAKLTTGLIGRLIFSCATFYSLSTLASPYTIDASHSEVGFGVKHMMISNVKGNFNKFEGTFDFDEKKEEVKNIDIKIEVSSINTNDKKRDEHLRSDDFFSAAKFPQMTFKSEKAVVKKGQKSKLSGTLTIKGVSKPIVLEVDFRGSATDPYGNERVGFSAVTKINRQDYGVKWSKNLDKGGAVVDDEVSINIEGEAIKVVKK